MKRLTSVVVMAMLVGGFAFTQTNLALKSARETSTYYAFSVGIAEALMHGTRGVNITVETSAGSVENVKMARMRNDYLFTSPPSLVTTATRSEGQFPEGGYERIRSLWPLPGLVMHWVVRQDSGVQNIRDLAGQRFVPGGAGSAGEQITRNILSSMGIVEQVNLMTVDLSEGVPAVRNRRAVGFGTSSTPPASMIQEIGATVPIRLLELSDADYARVSHLYTRATIPAGMYPGVNQPVKTVSLPVALYTTDSLPEQLAYDLTKAFWENRSRWESAHPAMRLIAMEDVNYMEVRLHPGALRYYREIGFDVAPALR
ncbi:MAG: TAXI family TRAP transporter solute-binding subunit [Spirochaetaceae bacterium]|nr:MAG: TAXI family TRAP transporter solute-binding subunit [Spirochaetaceae bacterium]